jgi:error-prone DNA polymerase
VTAASPAYAELFCRSYFSFLEGAASPEELVAQAAELGLGALAITDRDGVYGMVRAHRAARDHGVQLVVGALLTLRDHPSLVVLVRDRAGWANLCRLLTIGRREQPKGLALHSLTDLLEHAGGLTALLHGPWSVAQLSTLREAFQDRLALAVSCAQQPGDAAQVGATMRLARWAGVPLVAVGDVQLHHPDRKRLLDVITCIRRRTTIDQAGRALAPNAARVLRSPAQAAALFRAVGQAIGGDAPGRLADAVRVSAAIAAEHSFSLAQLDYRYPREVVPSGHSPMSWLVQLVRQGLAERYPPAVPAKVQAQVDHELGIIDQLGFAAYFLTVHDAVRFARSRGILCQGRGSAANSAVCFALGITAVDPSRSTLLFERFISAERGEPPDIDVDFEHERREELIQYLYEKYGRHRAAMVNEVIAYRRRSAVRDVGKALGLGLDQIDAMARQADYWGREPITDEQLQAAGLEPDDSRVRLTVDLSDELRGFPRHVGIHVGGFVLTDDDLSGRVPIEPATMQGRTVIQWDKDDIDDVGFVKVDLLSLGMLTAIRKAFDLVAGFAPAGPIPDDPADARQFTTPAGPGEGAPHPAPPWGRRWTLASVPAEDPAVYDMICRADTVGVFQIESRAQMSMLPRLRPRCFYDLVIEVAIVRPGPIQGGMVHPYLRRRQGLEPVHYPHPALEPILARTLGVPIFQEQVMASAMAVAGFSAGQADRLRRSMAAWRRKGTLGPIAEEFRRGLETNGITGAYADRMVEQIKGFGEYGFPESHAASFALLVYVSCWLKHHYPGAFCAALINSQPMGFYTPRALVADAQRHGVEVRPVDATRSCWDCTLEPSSDDPGVPALRLGLRLVRGFGQHWAEQLERARADGAMRSLGDLAARSQLPRAALELLARADAFQALGLPRRRALWAVAGLWDTPLFAGVARRAPPPELPVASPREQLESDYAAVGLSVHQHPIGLERARLTERGVRSVVQLAEVDAGRMVRVAGLISCRQRPGTASGVVFLTLEDETGQLNVVIWPKLYERQRRIVRTATLVEVRGKLQRENEALSLVAHSIAELEQAPDVSPRSRDFH